MSKVLRVLAVVLAVVFMASIAYADANSGAKWVYSTQKLNSSGGYQTSLVPTTTIRPKIDKVVGFSITILDATKSVEAVAALYDGTDATLSGEVIGESEAPYKGAITEMFPNPKYVEDGVAVQQGANTIVTIYFIRE